MRAFAVLFLLALPLCADVLVLKDGTQVGGRVVEKSTHYEITNDAGLRTYLKEEVDRVLKDPKEIVGDAPALYEQAKKAFEAALAVADPQQQNVQLKDAIGKLTQARENLALARELFPEDRYASLDQQLMQVMQLLRLLRDRLGSEFARRPSSGPAVVNARPSMPLGAALGILQDPARRADVAQRAAAKDAFLELRRAHPEIYDVATAAMVFLSRSDAEWKIAAPVQSALTAYFASPWFKDPLKLPAVGHQEAAMFLATKIAELKKSDARADVEPLTLFSIGHLGHAPVGAESEAAARLLGLSVRNGIPGTLEGHAVRDMNAWIASDDFDLAVLAFVKEHRATDTPIVRFVWSYALLRLVQARQRGFERPIAALQSIRTPDKPFFDHLIALQKSIKEAAVCNVCTGATKLRCTNCHGKRETRFDCDKCKGSGKQSDAFSTFNCYPCRGRGYMKLIRCEKCKDGFKDCPQRCKEPKTPPGLEEICAGTACGTCDARGFVFRRILYACRSCMGLGQKLSPKADPSKALP